MHTALKQREQVTSIFGLFVSSACNLPVQQYKIHWTFQSLNASCNWKLLLAPVLSYTISPSLNFIRHFGDPHWPLTCSFLQGPASLSVAPPAGRVPPDGTDVRRSSSAARPCCCPLPLPHPAHTQRVYHHSGDCTGERSWPLTPTEEHRVRPLLCHLLQERWSVKIFHLSICRRRKYIQTLEKCDFIIKKKKQDSGPDEATGNSSSEHNALFTDVNVVYTTVQSFLCLFTLWSSVSPEEK